MPSRLAGLLLIVGLWACLRELEVALWAALLACGFAAFDPTAFEYAVTALLAALAAVRTGCAAASTSSTW